MDAEALWNSITELTAENARLQGDLDIERAHCLEWTRLEGVARAERDAAVGLLRKGLDVTRDALPVGRALEPIVADWFREVSGWFSEHPARAALAEPTEATE
jgi:hypothetical protein